MSRTATRLSVLTMHYSPEHSGNAPYVTALARALAASQAFEVNVLTTPPHYPIGTHSRMRARWVQSEEDGDVNVTRLAHFVPRRLTTMTRVLYEVSLGLRLVFTRWQQPQVVLLVSPALLSSLLARVRAALLPRRAGVVTWVQDIYTLGLRETGTGGTRAARFMAKLESWLLNRSDHVVVIHDRFREFALREFGLDPARVSVIRNWTHLRQLAHQPPEDVRARYGWGRDEIIVLHAGNQGVKQGLENVVEAARLADSTDQPVRFVLLGSGNRHSALVKLATDVRKISFLPSLADHDYQAVMQSSDILLVNELSELNEMSVPSKLTSYFSTGRPVIAATSARSVTAEEVRQSGAGVIVSPDSPPDLLQAAITLGSDPNRARALGEMGRQFMLERLSEESAVAAFSLILERTAAGHRPRG